MFKGRGKVSCHWSAGILALLMFEGLFFTSEAATPLRIGGQNIQVAVSPVSDKTVRISLCPVTATRVSVLFDGLDLAPRNWVDPVGLVTNRGTEEVTVQASGLSVAIVPSSPLLVTVRRGTGTLIQQFSIDTGTGVVSFPLGTGQVFGLGGGFAQQMNRRGASYNMATNGLVSGFQTYGGTHAAPVLFSTGGWSVFFHMPWKAQIDLRSATGTYSITPAHTRDFFVIDGANPLEAVSEYFSLIGKPVMPPLYAFGYQQSHRTLAFGGRNYTLGDAHDFRSRSIPCDLMIFLGTGYADPGWNNGHGNFTFNTTAFPSPGPGRICDSLHAMGFEISLHVNSCPTALHGAIGDTGVSSSDASHVKNYWARHVPVLTTAKNKAWWPDDGDALDIPARLARHRIYYEGPLQATPNQRPYSLHRNAYVGISRYGGTVWSGDVSTNWETYRIHIPIGLNFGVSLSPYWTTDCGGFGDTPQQSGQLYARWLQWETFCPIMRSHGRPWPLHSPFGWDIRSASLLPDEWYQTFRPAMPDSSITPISKRYIELRYKLLPYIYTLAREAYDAGLPMMRPLWLHYPADSLASAQGYQYLFGKNMLVAPVYTQGATQRSLYLPAGTWYDFWTNTASNGARQISRTVDLATIPLYVPAGAIIPQGQLPRNGSTTSLTDSITFYIYSGANGSYTLYEDDGITLGYQNGIATWTTVTWDNATRNIAISGTSRITPSRSRTFRAVIIPENETRELSLVYGGGVSVHPTGAAAGAASSPEARYFRMIGRSFHLPRQYTGRVTEAAVYTCQGRRVSGVVVRNGMVSIPKEIEAAANLYLVRIKTME
ncbi:MAG: glycoside hydrolase family 31 protein [Chitinispirillaceae bacterium]|nr:glycoside hydrolase family 31 protein [Chitinispirillaceae bacterium]